MAKKQKYTRAEAYEMIEQLEFLLQKLSDQIATGPSIKEQFQINKKILKIQKEILKLQKEYSIN